MTSFALLVSLVSLATTATATVFVPGTWTLTQQGTTGVSAMQLSVVGPTKAIIFDKVEHNPLKRANGSSAWAVEYDFVTNTARPLNPVTDTFCAAGAHLSNGTLVSTGGSIVNASGLADGIQSLRLFDSCIDGTCDVVENPSRLVMTSKRWYPTASRLDDGSAIIFGGSFHGVYINDDEANNPTYEFYPPKNINGHNGTQIPSQFLVDTLNGNLFPHIYVLPDKTLFVAANQGAMIFNWRTNTERRLPNFPNGVRVTYPFQSAGALLPLSYQDNFTPRFLTCGGSTVSDTTNVTSLSSQDPASDQCSRMTLTASGIAAGWEVEHLPSPRTMGEAILLPDGRVLIINGAGSGVAGYGNVPDVIGQSNADHPVFQPVLYDPQAPAGHRFSSAGLPNSTIPRMYHSTSSLLPDGRIIIAGSNPNLDVSTVKYQTEYRVEYLSPPYLKSPRPTVSGLPSKIKYGSTFKFKVALPTKAKTVSVALMDLGFATHSVHSDQRLVLLKASLSGDDKTVKVDAPPTTGVYPPGIGYLFVVADGVPSVGQQVMIGSGASPPVDFGALANLQNIVKAQLEQGDNATVVSSSSRRAA